MGVGLIVEPGMDAYAIEVERVRERLVALGKLDHSRFHSRHVVGLYVSAPSAGKVGELDATATVVCPSNDGLGGALVYVALRALRQHSPGAFVEAMRRLADAGLVGRTT